MPNTSLRAAAALAVLALSPAALRADPAEDFYQGKQLRLIVGVAAGDGYDLWSRLVARHMAGHIPGRPRIIVQNMPGAGMITAANYLYNIAPRDGTAFGSISRSLPPQAVLERPNIKFDPRQVGWIGSPETVNRVCAVGPSATVKTIDDVFEQEAVVGGIASLPGAVIGGVFVQVIEKYADALTKKITAAVNLPIDLEPWTIYGIALIVLMYTMPMGIAGGFAVLWRRLKGS
jgi:tripartite-type tricarboxylate transporter receptor subunit TctC